MEKASKGSVALLAFTYFVWGALFATLVMLIIFKHHI